MVTWYMRVCTRLSYFSSQRWVGGVTWEQESVMFETVCLATKKMVIVGNLVTKVIYVVKW